jgi:pilus assembly protein CpaF
MSAAERVVTIEDTLELSINYPNVVRLETFAASKGQSGLTARELVKNTLRMRPDRIIVGEVRGGELFDLLQAMNTGHDGSMSSIHANSPGECISRMENLFLMSGYEVPFQVVRKQIAQGVDFIIQLGRDREGNRIVNQIMEITGMEGPNILSQQLAVREEEGLVSTGISPKNIDRLHRHGGLPLDFFN